MGVEAKPSEISTASKSRGGEFLAGGIGQSRLGNNIDRNVGHLGIQQDNVDKDGISYFCVKIFQKLCF
jgi:hypothetical protein